MGLSDLGAGGLSQQVDGLEVVELHFSEMSMARRLLKESLIVIGGTLFFLALAATVGIPGDEETPAPAAASEGKSRTSEQLGPHHFFASPTDEW